MNYNDVIARGISVMDPAAVLLTRDHGLPLHVFNFDEAGAMRRICEGEELGTLIADAGSEFSA